MQDEPSSRRPKLNSLQLRRIAEWASGDRDEAFEFVVDPDGKVSKKKPGEVAPPDSVTIPVWTPLRDPDRPELIEASVQAKGAAKPVDLLNLKTKDGTPLGRADSVFWTESAVEKFVIPYYASVYGWEAGAKISALLEAFEPSKSGNDATQVFAMAHIPKSEYLMLNEEPTAAAGFHVVFQQGKSAPQVLPLETFLSLKAAPPK
jgi:hypothetical protein